ncbi:phospholipase [Acinetobacter qingfengensis]|uniref:Phospholipase n=1 Tax=Acinetobacter qingfengensis TaxID=1262585 RepID=A0A1E7RCX9_9GAMM|nr:phospholipase D-like domain-containing protein [Acinetobacter qingfengensis]KAA8732112.1 phospholipase [Acinetobacter qingfengensis]OEY97191.1 phospholipase [Acinetobacter qingfengensis]
MLKFFTVGRNSLRLTLSCLFGLSIINPAFAKVESQGFELVYNAPVETSLQNSDLRSAAPVWREMFDQAKYKIDIAQFYVYSQPDSSLDDVIAALERAGQRGVHIRFLVDKKGIGMSNPETLNRIKSIPNLQFRVMDFSKIQNGIIHAKYFIVDAKEAFVGSQNFDWRALTHIQETGLRITDLTTVQQIQNIFSLDWKNQQKIEQQQDIVKTTQHVQLRSPRTGQYLLASPSIVTPENTYETEKVFPTLLAEAKSSIDIQVMQYAPLQYSENGVREFYALIDNSLRAAAARGVKVKLMVSNWNLKQPDLAWLKSLALVPNVQVKIVTIPESKDGFIPFARVVHSKYMVIDQNTAWVGTSNWQGGYFDNSRNLEIVLNNPVLANRLHQLYQQLWQSTYAETLKIDQQYRYVNPGKKE